MANDQVPLYLGIPLAILCVGAGAFMLAFAIVLWKDRCK